AEGGQLARRDRQIELLVLRPEQRHLRDVRLAEEGGARLLGEVPHLAPAEAVEGQAVDDTEDVAELVVEEGAADAGRQGLANVRYLLADLVPDAVEVGRLGRF